MLLSMEVKRLLGRAIGAPSVEDLHAPCGGSSPVAIVDQC
jgi:hypothetical protein